MYRWCISLPCNPRDVYFLSDERCNDNMRREFQACYDSCVMPSGPNPDITIRAAWTQPFWVGLEGSKAVRPHFRGCHWVL